MVVTSGSIYIIYGNNTESNFTTSESAIQLDGVFMRRNSKLLYDIGDNRGKLCEFLSVGYSTCWEKKSAHINWIEVRRYYEDEKRWSTGSHKIPSTLIYNFVSVIESENLPIPENVTKFEITNIPVQ